MITRLGITSYRGLESFELPLAGRPSTLLIGNNGTGKSSVGQALELLQLIARGTNRVGALVQPLDLTGGQTDRAMSFEVEVVLGECTYLFVLVLELPTGWRELRVKAERLLVDGEVVYERELVRRPAATPQDGTEVSQVRFRRTPGEEPAGFLMDWHLVALPVIQEPSVHHPLREFRTWLERLLVLTPVPAVMRGESKDASIWPDRQVSNFGEWVTGLLADWPAAYGHLDRYLRQVMPDFKDLQNPPTGTERRSLMVQFEQGGRHLKLPFDQLSDGEKCYFLCAVVLAANQTYGPLCCFWDEPDNYLSIAEVGHFVLDLRRSFQQGGQLIATSHHAESMRSFSAENTFLLQRSSHLDRTVARPVSELKYDGDLVAALTRGDLDP